MNALYQVLIFLFAVAYFPLFMFQYLTQKKYRGNLRAKLGLKAYSFDQSKPTIWVHAVSVGEIKAVSTLLKKLKEKHPGYQFIISSITETGNQEAKKSVSFADHHILLPLDFKRATQRLVHGLNLKMVLLVETDVWPNFLQACYKKGAYITLVNGKVSARSFNRLRKVPFFTRWYFKPFHQLQVQDKTYQERFIELGVPAKNISVVPNIKLDDQYPELSDEKLQELKKQFGIDDLCITVGSTHEGEEKAILEELAPLLIENPGLKILLVPRHPERNGEVEKLLVKMNLSYGRLSENKALSRKTVILVDTMGFLRTCYQLAHVAIVAGSFTSKVGGHNILEPLWYSTPSVFGPYMHSQAQFLHLVKEANAGVQVPIHDLKKNIERLLNQASERAELGRRGRAIFDEASGGSELAFNFLQKTLADNSGKV